MKPLFFGEGDRMDDGGFAIGEHEGTRLQLGDAVVPVGFWLRYVRGLLHSSGRRFAIGSHQDTNRVWLVRDDGTKVELGKRNGFGLAIHEVSAGVEVAYMPTGATWRAETFTLDLDFLHSRSGTTSNTSQGLIDFGPDGVPIVAVDPLDRPIGGSSHNVRWLVRRGDVEFGKALGPLPDGLLMAAGGQVGTLSHGRVFETYNVSPNGFFWCGQHLASETVVYGDVPAIVPPLVLKPPTELKPIPVPSLTRLIWRGMDGWDGTTVHRMTGNFAWSEQPGLPVRKVFEGPPWSTRVFTPMLAVLIGTERDYKPYTSKERQLAAAIADADLKQCPVAVYSDGPTFTATAEGFAKRVKADGGDVVRVLQFYPPTTKTEVENEIKRLRSTGPLGLMVPVYTANGEWSEADLERVLTEAQSLIAKYYPLIRIESAFGGKRADASARAVAYMAGVIAAMPAGDPPSLVDAGTPHHEPEPQPEPEPEPDDFFPELRSLF